MQVNIVVSRAPNVLAWAGELANGIGRCHVRMDTMILDLGKLTGVDKLTIDL
jgi:hypothetical protein